MDDLEHMEEALELLSVKLKTLELDDKTRACWQRILDHMSGMKDVLCELEDLLNATHGPELRNLKGVGSNSPGQRPGSTDAAFPNPERVAQTSPEPPDAKNFVQPLSGLKDPDSR